MDKKIWRKKNVNHMPTTRFTNSKLWCLYPLVVSSLILNLEIFLKKKQHKLFSLFFSVEWKQKYKQQNFIFISIRIRRTTTWTNTFCISVAPLFIGMLGLCAYLFLFLFLVLKPKIICPWWKEAILLYASPKNTDIFTI